MPDFRSKPHDGGAPVQTGTQRQKTDELTRSQAPVAAHFVHENGNGRS
jgi:hypothetical protein